MKFCVVLAIRFICVFFHLASLNKRIIAILSDRKLYQAKEAQHFDISRAGVILSYDLS